MSTKYEKVGEWTKDWTLICIIILELMGKNDDCLEDQGLSIIKKTSSSLHFIKLLLQKPHQFLIETLLSTEKFLMQQKFP